MVEYTVKWEMTMEADTPREAAEKALEVHRDPESIATFFTVVHPEGETVEVDLEEGVWACTGCGAQGSSDDHVYDDDKGRCMDCQEKEN